MTVEEASCNRTIVGLKALQSQQQQSPQVGLQSHHSGIESFRSICALRHLWLLQSHHSGIESRRNGDGRNRY